jgi:acyl carrier protein
LTARHSRKKHRAKAAERSGGYSVETKEILLEILTGLRPKVDFESSQTLIDDGLLDSFDIAAIIADISEEFDIKITANEIVPDNFNSINALCALVERLID